MSKLRRMTGSSCVKRPLGPSISPANASRQGIEGENHSGVSVDHHGVMNRRDRQVVIARQTGANRSSRRQRQRCVAAAGDRHPRQAPRFLPSVGLRCRPIPIRWRCWRHHPQGAGNHMAGSISSASLSSRSASSLRSGALGESWREGAQGQIMSVLSRACAGRAGSISASRSTADRANDAFVILSGRSKESSRAPSKRSAQRCWPLAASTSWQLIRTGCPPRAGCPRPHRTPSSRAICFKSAALPL